MRERSYEDTKTQHGPLGEANFKPIERCRCLLNEFQDTPRLSHSTRKRRVGAEESRPEMQVYARPCLAGQKRPVRCILSERFGRFGEKLGFFVRLDKTLDTSFPPLQTWGIE